MIGSRIRRSTDQVEVTLTDLDLPTGLGFGLRDGGEIVMVDISVGWTVVAAAPSPSAPPPTPDLMASMHRRILHALDCEDFEQVEEQCPLPGSRPDWFQVPGGHRESLYVAYVASRNWIATMRDELARLPDDPDQRSALLERMAAEIAEATAPWGKSAAERNQANVTFVAAEELAAAGIGRTKPDAAGSGRLARAEAATSGMVPER